MIAVQCAQKVQTNWAPGPNFPLFSGKAVGLGSTFREPIRLAQVLVKFCTGRPVSRVPDSRAPDKMPKIQKYKGAFFCLRKYLHWPNFLTQTPL